MMRKFICREFAGGGKGAGAGCGGGVSALCVCRVPFLAAVYVCFYNFEKRISLKPMVFEILIPEVLGHMGGGYMLLEYIHALHLGHS